MFSVPGSHTFFLPVDSAFDVSVFRSGYRYDDRNRGFSIPGQSSLDTVVNSSPVSRPVGALFDPWRPPTLTTFDFSLPTAAESPEGAGGPEGGRGPHCPPPAHLHQPGAFRRVSDRGLDQGGFPGQRQPPDSHRTGRPRWRRRGLRRRGQRTGPGRRPGTRPELRVQRLPGGGPPAGGQELRRTGPAEEGRGAVQHHHGGQDALEGHGRVEGGPGQHPRRQRGCPPDRAAPDDSGQVLVRVPDGERQSTYSVEGPEILEAL